MKMKSNIDIYQEITSKIIELMEEHGTDWTKPWACRGMPQNGTTKTPYHGINILLLGLSADMLGFNSNEWATFKQWKGKGAQVKKGQKGTMGVFYKKIQIEDKETKEKKTIPLMRSFTLFNADQVEGYKSPVLQTNDNERKERCEQLIQASGADISHYGDRAYYRPSEDKITLPLLESFDSAETYYSTAFHELAHWTGHGSRLDRKQEWDKKAYAFEELVAEMSSAFSDILTGNSHEPRPDHAKYLNSWISVLKSDKKAFSSATGKAQKATDYLFSLMSEEKAA